MFPRFPNKTHIDGFRVGVRILTVNDIHCHYETVTQKRALAIGMHYWGHDSRAYMQRLLRFCKPHSSAHIFHEEIPLHLCMQGRLTLIDWNNQIFDWHSINKNWATAFWDHRNSGERMTEQKTLPISRTCLHNSLAGPGQSRVGQTAACSMVFFSN